MRRFLHYLQRFLLYAIIIGNINGVIFAVDDADLNEDSEERLDSNGDDEKNVDDIKPRKARIHSTVDNILRINIPFIASL